jgi:4-amino-4-deoxy-L-arabinose transferase-like glycosyltransferase
MVKLTPTHPPFAWLGRYWNSVGLGLVAITAGFFRVFQLNSLPPGLDEASARIGTLSQNLATSGWLPPLDSSNGYAPAWFWLQAISIQVFGHTALALRLWPALLGTLAVVVTWLWLRNWFGLRIAWIGALTMAVSPWAVTVSRSGVDSALLTLLVPLTLWLGTRALRHPGTKQYAAFGAVLAADLLSGPIGWLLALCSLGLSVRRLAVEHNLLKFNRPRVVGAVLFGVGAAVLGYFIGTSMPAISSMSRALDLTTNPTTIGGNIIKVLLMFNVHGDDNYRHNLAGAPLLNAFVGLMLVTGVLVGISRLHQLRYRVLLSFTLVMLLPAIITTVGVPNSSWAVGALPLIFGLVGVGTSYMLELWYATFPINSAARATGQAAIILLLALTLVQGYTQYFRAWAGSTAVYSAFNEGTVSIAEHVKTDKFSGERYIVIPSGQVPIIAYLDHGYAGYQIITPGQLQALPVTTVSRQFYIDTSSRDEAVKTLKVKFPGGTLQPHYSGFNQVEIYYTYEARK